MKNFILLLLFISTFAQAQNKDVSLVLPWKHQFQFAGYYVAKEMGFYEKAGLSVNIKEYNLKRDNTKAVSSQKFDFGIGHSSL
ncbi:MAG: ABC-type nitrate/sulfonate/bicarbonate transport system substrate-binding protein, partial [Sulfurimonas sp.]